MKSVAWPLVAIALVCCLSMPASADVVYQQNTSAIYFPQLATGGADSSEVGDQVLLQGIGRELVEALMVIQNEANGLGAYNVDIITRIRLLDGVGNIPGTLIHTQTDSLVGVPEGAFFLTLGFANIVVPDEFAIMFEIVRQGGNTGNFGFHWSANPATIGSSDPTFLWFENPNGSGTFVQASFGGTNANMRLQLTTVPEPTTAGAIAIGLIGIAFSSRRRVR